MNDKEIIFLVSALLGFITIFMIGNRYKKNRPTNVFLVVIFATTSMRFLYNSLVDVTYISSHLRVLDLFIFVSTSPLVYLYFKKLVNTHFKKNDLVHLLTAAFIFLVFNYIAIQHTGTTALKIRVIFLFAYNLFYVVKSYLLLNKFVWKRSSDIIMIDQQNLLIKKWTIILFGFFILILLRFMVNFFMNKPGFFWYENNNDYLWISAIIWIVLYLRILYSPEFLYGYDLFQNKIKEYKKHKIVFDNIWVIKNTITQTNQQDIILKDKIDLEIENYIAQIEKIAIDFPLFFTEAFKPLDLSHKLNIPKSHVVYLFKYHAKISFNDFKKIIRIQNAIGLIENGFLKVNTLEALAAEIGFSSYSAFFKSFKSVIGISPKEYCDKS